MFDNFSFILNVKQMQNRHIFLMASDFFPSNSTESTMFYVS